MKTLSIILIGLLVFSIFSIIIYKGVFNMEEKEKPQYQGPVHYEDMPGFVGPKREVVPSDFIGPLQPHQRWEDISQQTPTFTFQNAGGIYTKEQADAVERQQRFLRALEDKQRQIELEKARQQQIKLEQQKAVEQAKLKTSVIASIKGARGSWKTQLQERKTESLLEKQKFKLNIPDIRDTSLEKTGGLYYVTPTEAEGIRKAGGTREPVWEIESKTPYEIIDIESKYTGSPKISAVNLGYGISRGQFESNKLQINLAKEGFRVEQEIRKDIEKVSREFQENPESFKGEIGFIEEVSEEGEVTYSLDIDKYIKNLSSYKKLEKYQEQFTEEGTLKPEVYTKKLKEVKKDFMSLGKKERVLGATAETQLAFFNLPIRTAEGLITFGSKLGVQTFKKDDERNWYGGVKGKDFKFGGIAGRITNIPSVQPSYEFTKQPLKYIGETITTRPSVTFPVGLGVAVGYGLGKGAISNIKGYGLTTGTLETLKYFSPLRIKSTLFYPEVTGATKFVGKSIQLEKGGKTFTKYVGAEKGFPEIKLETYQLAGSKGGVGISTIQTPQFTYLGGELTKGVRTSSFLSSFTGEQVGNIGFVGTSKTIPLYSSVIDVKGLGRLDILTGQKPTTTKFSGVSQKFPETENIFAFTSGEKLFGFEKTSGLLDLSEYETISGFQPQVSGLGIKFKFPSAEGTDVKIIRGSGTKTPFSKTFTTPTETLITPKFEFPKVDIITTPPTTNIFSTPLISQSLIPTSFKTLEKDEQESFSRFGSLGVLDTKFKTGQETKDEQKTKPMSSLLTGTLSKPSVREEEAVGLAQPLKQTQPTKQQQKQQVVLSSLFFKPISITQPRVSYPEEVIEGFGLGFARKRKTIPDKSAYDVYYLKEGTKPKKKRWIKLADNVSRTDALSIGSEKVDKDVSRRFKLTKDKGEPKPSKRSDWFNREQKFRPFKIIKDRKYPMHNEWIEKTSFAIDSPQEKKQLAKAKEVSMSNLLIGGNSKGKRRTPFGF